MVRLNSAAKRGLPVAGLALLFASIVSASADAKIPVTRHLGQPVLATKRTVPPALTVAEEGLVQPVVSGCISSPFGMRHNPALPMLTGFHNGIDLPAPIGAPVVAVAPGTLIRVQHKGLGGLEMLVQHKGFIGVYSHLGLIAPAILEGERTIQAGEKLGTVGMTGLTLGPHLFFAMIVRDQPVDPAGFLSLPPCGQKDGEAHNPRHAPPQPRAATRLPSTGPALLPPTRVLRLARSPADARRALLPSAPN